ncbi:E3 ubiquitin-protein ligase TRIM21-like [Astyanax mexicanus]|uniref:E3 ubiquitin-protein ligase TRIM21-like n=1 Tax=Astyanax mexicanus TaxID=7994 RepID=A0A8T2LS92_ASTMX|nr:E3 ubiquitin-protein ligase TRIM21-like [Astyanax mexicanus]
MAECSATLQQRETSEKTDEPDNVSETNSGAGAGAAEETRAAVASPGSSSEDEVRDEQRQDLDEPGVPCDICTGEKAQISCLDCGLTYCKSHFEHHYNVQKLKIHKLINPVKNLEDYICQKHKKPLELFCKDDQAHLCQFCMELEHTTHNVVHINKTQVQIKDMIQEREDKIKKITHTVERRKENTNRVISDSKDVFTALKDSITRLQTEVLEVMEEKQKAAERQAEDLEQEITELKRRDTELEQLSHTEDRLHLLQIYTFLSPSLTTNCSDICVYSNVSVETVRQLQRSLNEEFTKTLKEIRQPDTVEVFTAPMHSIEKLGAEPLEVMEGKKAAERRAEDLEQKITELNRRYNEDHLHLLQLYTSLNLLLTSNCSDFSVEPHLSEETVRKNLSQLQSLNEKLTKTLQKIRQPVDLEELKRIYQHKEDVTLDPDTAHPNLILSDDRKQVRYGDKKQKCPDKPERFDKYIDVLGNEEFSSGRFYYEVQVRGKTEWSLGVVKESVDRKGEIILAPQNGFWTLIMRNGNKYTACAEHPIPRPLRGKPQKVGVFVDYEKGLVSFYDVEARSLIYSYTDQSFTEKLYPFFSPGLNDDGKNSAPLIITPVSNTE